MNIPEPIMRILTILAMLAPFILFLFGFDIQPILDWVGQGVAVIVAAALQIAVIVNQILQYIRDWRKVRGEHVTFAQYNFMHARARQVLYAV